MNEKPFVLAGLVGIFSAWLWFRRRDRWKRDDECTYTLLLLTGEGALVPREAISSWTDVQCREAEAWAGAAHLHASDNDDVEVPPIPAHVAAHDTAENRKRLLDEEDRFWQRGKGAP